MCLNMSEEATLLAPKPVRPPLDNQTNSRNNFASFSSTEEHKQAVRHTGSFVRRLDSSEDLPSSQDSIFIAEYLSPYNSDESGSGYKLETWNKTISGQETPLSPRLELPALPSTLSSLSSTPSENNDENGNQKLNIGTTPILYGHGTPLTTIIEQRSSMGTLRESASTTSGIRPLARPRSTSDLTASTTSFPAGPIRTGPRSSPLRNQRFSTSGIIGRIHSLSADDSADSIKLSWPAGYDPRGASWRGKSSVDSESTPTSPINEVYAQPLRPINPPVERPATPEGMPSWTQAQHLHRAQRRLANAQGETRRGWNLHEASSMLHRLFSNRSQREAPAPQDAMNESASPNRSGYGIRGPWDAVPAYRRAVSAPVLRGAPHFSSPRSATGVARLEMHPFARAGGAQLSSKSEATADMAAPPAVRRSTSLRRSISLGRSSNLRIFNGGAVTGTVQTIRLVDEGDPQPHHRVLSLRGKGKRKPGQRVRFTPSTVDPGTVPQRASGTFSDPGVKVCPHTKRKRDSVQLWVITGAPLAGAHDVCGPLSLNPITPVITGAPLAGAHDACGPLSSNPVTPVDSDPRSSNTDRIPSLESVTASPTRPSGGEAPLLNRDTTPLADTLSVPDPVTDDARTPVEKGGFKSRNHCWKCRLENVAKKMDRAWEVSRRWACWYCCGIEMDEERVRSPAPGVRVTRFEPVRA